MATSDLIQATTATVIKLETGDILFLQLPEEILSSPDIISEMMNGLQHALDVTGHSDDVAVLLTTDAIKLTVVRPSDEA